MTVLFALLLVLAAPDAGRAAAEPVRVSVLSLVEPQRVTLGAPARIATGGGAGEIAPEGTVVERVGASVRIRRGAARGRVAKTVRIGAPGASTALVVEGRNRIARAIAGPVTVSSDGRRLALVAEVDREALVASAVAAEMENETNAAALEAAAIAIRSYLATSRGRHARAGFDVCDTTHCLFSKGVPDGSASNRAAVAAAEATRGRGLVREGRVVAGYYTACCGGETTVPSRAWGGRETGDHRAVSCSWCAASPYFRWQREAPVAGVHAALEALAGWRVASDAEIRLERDADGWLRRAVVRSRGRERALAGEPFRLAIGRRLGWDTLPSARFAAERRGGRYFFSGRGFGHGVGLCLAGALALGRDGASRDEILATYYPAARIASLP